VGLEDEADKQAKLIVETFQRENPGVERYVAAFCCLVAVSRC